MKEESEKVGLKLSIQKTKIMASGPITSWQIDGETMDTMTELFLFCFVFWTPKSLQMVTVAIKLLGAKKKRKKEKQRKIKKIRKKKSN